MRATNININEFIGVLVNMRNEGVRAINLDLLPDENNPSMNKLMVQPFSMNPNNIPNVKQEERTQTPNSFIRNPEIRTDNNDIFNLFNDIV